MAESIARRVGGMKIGKMSQKELLKILLSLQSDIANFRTTANAIVLDLRALANNTGSANNTVQITAANVAAMNTTV
jgi:hypothetical protein